MAADTLSPSGAARRLGVSVTWVRQLGDSGRLPVTPTPLGRLFDAKAVENFAREREQRRRPVDQSMPTRHE